MIPYGVETHHRGDWNTFYQIEGIERPVGDNQRLIAYLREKFVQEKIEIMLHGYNHLYQVREARNVKQCVANKGNLEVLRAKKRGEDLEWIPECIWKSEQQLKQELQKGKNYLESLFSNPINVFVPPSNSIGVAGARALDALQLNLSGVIGRKKDRDWSYDYVRAYLKRTGFYLRYNGAVYPFPVRIREHSELAACSLTPLVNFEELKKQAEIYQRIGAPFVLATHHWEFDQHPAMKTILKLLVDFLLAHDEYHPVKLSTLFKSG